MQWLFAPHVDNLILPESIPHPYISNAVSRLHQFTVMKKNIAVMTGGSASELGISLKSAGVVCKHLDKEKYNVFKVVIKEDGWMVERDNPVPLPIDKNDFTFTIEGHKITFDAVFVAIHGTPAEDGKLQGYFDLLHIPYNCCGVLQAALTFDKQRCKEYLSAIGIRTAKATLLRAGQAYDSTAIAAAMGLPLFVKPNKNGSSYGAAKADTTEALASAIENAFRYDDEILVEEFLQGKEVTCGAMIINGKVTALPITEIRTKQAFFDYQAKYEGASEEITPAEIDAELYASIQRTTETIYQHLGFKGMCRIDYIITNDQYYMLEVNSIPGLSEESIVPKQAAAMGISLSQLFDISVQACLPPQK